MARAAVVQMNSGDDLSRNLARAAELLAQAADCGADLVVLPENFAFMPPAERARREVAEADGNGPAQDFLAREAQRHRIWIVGGTVPLVDDDKRLPAAACLVFNASGRRVARYDKIHLFDVAVPGSGESYRESRATQAGAVPVLVDTPCGRLGVTVCYDLRFPELYRELQAGGADGFAVPAAFTARTGRAHWDILLRARAIENLGFVLAAAQVGEHPGGRRTYGHSMIVDAWGEVLEVAGNGETVVTAQLDLRRQAQIRQEFPALEHRRIGIGADERNKQGEK